MKYLKAKFKNGGLAQAAGAVRSAGRYGDRHLVHVNDREMNEMRRAWGEPTVHPETGMPEFFDIGGLLSDIVSGISDVVQPVAQIAQPILSLLGGAPVAPGSGQTVSSYTPPIGQGGPHLTTIAAPSASRSTNGIGGLIGALLNPKSNPLGAAALTTLVDTLFKPKTPSVADQLSTVQQAANRNTYGWNTPLPTASYNNPAQYPTGYDYTKYGQAGQPGIDFYPGTDVPIVNRKRGGMGRFLNGPDGGQEDTVPANLSDGEYVMDATTVSDLGDGNPSAGARKLDQMRDSIARHKGRKKRVPNKAHANALAYLPGAK